MALTRIQPPALADVREPNFRNICINGNMAVSQRSTSVASITSSGYNTVDRWKNTMSSLGTWTISQSTDVPSGQGFASSLKYDCTTADASPSASDYSNLRQIFEGQNLQYLKVGTSSAQSLTASFWVKSNKTGTYICTLNAAGRFISKSYTISVADTWEKKTITYAGDTAGTMANTNANGLEIFLWLGAGSDFTSGTLQTSWNSVTNANYAVGQVNLADSTSNEWYVTGVQLEAGSVATDFEVDTFAQNLERCRRYCVVLGDAPGGSAYDTFFKGVIGHYYNTTDFYPNFNYPVVMRGVPGVTWSTTSSGFGSVESAGSAHANTSTGTNWTGNTNMNFRVSTSSATAGDGGSLDFLTSQYVLLSAEL